MFFINKYRYVVISLVTLGFFSSFYVGKQLTFESRVLGQSSVNRVVQPTPEQVVQPTPEQEDKSKMSEIGVDGNSMRAFLVAYDDFMKEPKIELTKKQIKNYNIGFQYVDGIYQIRFVPKRETGEKLLFGGSTSLGKIVKYWIDDKTFQIIERKFVR